MKKIYKSFLLFIFLVLMGCSAANLVVDPYA
ncbi:type VI secretion system-associated lipoprotein, partial [Vibrio parahaemolyticus]